MSLLSILRTLLLIPERPRSRPATPRRVTDAGARHHAPPAAALPAMLPQPALRSLRAVVIADTVPEPTDLPEGPVDLLLSLGDMPDAALMQVHAALGEPPTFAVRGNHDPAWPLPAPVVDLHGRVVEHRGLRLGGIAGSPRYRTGSPHQYDDAEVSALLAAMPPCDVLISHNAPLGIHDQPESRSHHGFRALRERLDAPEPLVVLHGHQHVEAATAVGPHWVVGTYGLRTLALALPER